MGRKVAVPARAESSLPRVEDDLAPEVEVGIEDEADNPGDDSLDADSLDVSGATTDNVGEQSIEINVEGLIAELEAESQRVAPDVQCARRKLEDYLERKRIAHELEDFEDFVVGG